MFTRRFNHRTAALLLLLSLCAGCDTSKPLPPPADLGDVGPGLNPSFFAEIEFSDEVKSNREDDGTVGDLQFVDTEGNSVRLDQFKDQKNVLLVFTRGFAGQLCPYCTTQTSRLIANYDRFSERDTEVLLVYPGSKEQLPMFKEASIAASATGQESFPFPVLLDEDLAAVNRLGIAAQLASPSTFIIDKQGQVRLSYVGSNPTDRPSIKALLSQLDGLAE